MRMIMETPKNPDAREDHLLLEKRTYPSFWRDVDPMSLSWCKDRCLKNESKSAPLKKPTFMFHT